MRRAILIALAATATTFVVVAGLRLSGEAIALIVGLGLGLLASLPAHLTLYRLATRPNLPAITPAPHSPSGAVTPPLPAPTLPRSPRHFITIGSNEPDSTP